MLNAKGLWNQFAKLSKNRNTIAQNLKRDVRGCFYPVGYSLCERVPVWTRRRFRGRVRRSYLQDQGVFNDINRSFGAVMLDLILLGLIDKIHA